MTYPDHGLKRALCRMGLPRGQVTLLKCLYEAERPLSMDEIADRIRGGNTRGARSILGPFSQRIEDTSGLSNGLGYRAFIDKRHIEGQSKYELRDDARRVIGDIPRLLDEFDRSMSELRDEENPVIGSHEFDAVTRTV